MKTTLFNFNYKTHEEHPFHLVDVSPWPLMTSISLFSLTLSFVMYFHNFKNGSFYLVSSLIILCFYLSRWFSDVITESTYEGYHTIKVQKGVGLGMSLFIISEIMFFFSFFWAFFHGELGPSTNIGWTFPPAQVITLDPWSLPYLNTIILISSGASITVSHNAILNGQREKMTNGLAVTILYGIIFTGIQYYEYCTAPFSVNDSVSGTLFFLLTGFHGFHVLVGSIFLIICLFRHYNYHFSTNHHMGFECAAWYWHFVDVVWLYLFIALYIWGVN
jgi:cytochrome c oxidase subunit 3